MADPDGLLRRVVASASSKVNLILRVGGADADGYHALATVFEALSLREYVVAELRDEDGGPTGVPGVGAGRGRTTGLGMAESAGVATRSLPRVRTLVYTDGADGVPVFSPALTEQMAQVDPGRHLAVRAAAALGADDRVSLTVHKTIPIAGGMAGGSADAAAALVAVNELLDLGLPIDELQVIGRKLGADVPACLVGGVALGTGRGDHMELLRPGTSRPNDNSNWWVLVLADFGLSTPAVFHRFDELYEGIRPDKAEPSGTSLNSPVTSVSTRAPAQAHSAVPIEPPGQHTPGPAHIPTQPHSSVPVEPAGQPTSPTQPAISSYEITELRRAAPAAELAPLLHNDLQAAALSMEPGLTTVGARLLELGALRWLVSGSGPTLAALAASRDQAEQIAAHIRTAALPGVRATAVAWGPGPGAQLEAVLPQWAIG